MKKLAHKRQLSRIWHQYCKMRKKWRECLKSWHRYGIVDVETQTKHPSWTISGAWDGMQEWVAEYKKSRSCERGAIEQADSGDNPL